MGTFLKNQYKTWISQNIQLSSKMGLSKEFTEELLVNYTLSIIKSWITQAIPESPEVFSKIQITLQAIYSRYYAKCLKLKKHQMNYLPCPFGVFQ